MMKVVVLQVFISTSAIVVLGLIWINFNNEVFKTVRHLAAAPVGILQVLTNYSAIVGIGLILIRFNNEFFKTVIYIATAPFSLPNKKDNSPPKKKDNSSIDRCVSSSKARTKIPESPPFYISWKQINFFFNIYFCFNNALMAHRDTDMADKDTEEEKISIREAAEDFIKDFIVGFLAAYTISIFLRMQKLLKN